MKDLLRFITCGGVDDGKSTLIGRLLADCGAIPDDQRATLDADSRRFGTQGAATDFALLVDGLAAEREQGITIDVAYRYFSTDKRSFIVADTPGHEQHTRNMATGASTADLAVILVDAAKGVLTQTRRHAYIAHLMGIDTVLLAVNKMDDIGYDRARYEAAAADFRAFAAELGIGRVAAIPISALSGDNVAARSDAMPWHEGPSLLEFLETAPVALPAAQSAPFRMPIQWVCRPDAGFRGYAGLIAAGTVSPGDNVRVMPSDRQAAVARIVAPDGDLAVATAGQSVMLTLASEVDCSRGDVLAASGDPPEIADQFETALVWMAEEEMLPGRSYWLKIGTVTVSATVTAVKYQVNVDTLEHVAARTLALNAIGVVNVALDRPVAFAPYADNRELGGFILIDRATNATVGAGMIRFALRRAHNIHWQQIDVTVEARAAAKHQRARVLWFTGLSGAGKSTIANLVEKKLHALGRHTFLLDGDNVRHGLNRDLGFTDADRVENIRRLGEVAKLMAEAGLIVLAASISPFRAERDMVRAMLPAGAFVEIHIDTSLAEAERRDVKGLYKKARAGELENFTGISSPYEPPEHAELVIDTTELTPEEAADRIVEFLLG